MRDGGGSVSFPNRSSFHFDMSECSRTLHCIVSSCYLYDVTSELSLTFVLDLVYLFVIECLTTREY